MKLLNTLREVRKSKKISQFEMAEHLGIGTNAYGKLERGESEMTISRLESISSKLGIDIKALFENNLEAKIKIEEFEKIIEPSLNEIDPKLVAILEHNSKNIDKILETMFNLFKKHSKK